MIGKQYFHSYNWTVLPIVLIIPLLINVLVPFIVTFVCVCVYVCIHAYEQTYIVQSIGGVSLVGHAQIETGNNLNPIAVVSREDRK